MLYALYILGMTVNHTFCIFTLYEPFLDYKCRGTCTFQSKNACNLASIMYNDKEAGNLINVIYRKKKNSSRNILQHYPTKNK